MSPHPEIPTPDEARPGLQFRLADVMIGLLALGLILGFLRWLIPEGGGQSYSGNLDGGGTLQVATVVFTLLYFVPLYSALWAACFGWSSEARFPIQPGHWLLISVGVSFCERMLTLEMDINDMDWRTFTVPLCWLPSCLIAIGALRTAPTQSWQAAFQYLVALRIAGIVAALAGVLIRLGTADPGHWSFELFVSSFIVIFPVLSCAALIRMMIAQTTDVEANIARGLLHSLGMAVACFDLILPWPWWRMLH